VQSRRLVNSIRLSHWTAH